MITTKMLKLALKGCHLTLKTTGKHKNDDDKAEEALCDYLNRLLVGVCNGQQGRI